MSKTFPGYFETYEEYERTLREVKKAGGFLLGTSSEKTLIHFLGLPDWEEHELLSFTTAISDQRELDSIIKPLRCTPLFRRMLSYIAMAWKLGDPDRGPWDRKVLIQGMPTIGKTYTYRMFKDLVLGPRSEHVYLDCTPNTSVGEIIDAVRCALQANDGEGTFLLVDHLDNLPPHVQEAFRVLGYRGGLEGPLRGAKPGRSFFVGFDATYPELVDGKYPVGPGLRARISAWLAISPKESEKYGS